MLKRWLTLAAAAALLAGIGAAAPFRTVSGETADTSAVSFLILFEGPWPDEQLTQVRQAGGRVTAVFPELGALEAEAASPRFADHMELAGGTVYGPETGARTCSAPGDTKSAGALQAAASETADADWAFHSAMERLPAVEEQPAGAKRPAGTTTAVLPGTACGPAAAAAAVAAVEQQAAVLRLTAVAPAPGSIDQVLYRRALLYAADHGVQVVTLPAS